MREVGKEFSVVWLVGWSPMAKRGQDLPLVHEVAKTSKGRRGPGIVADPHALVRARPCLHTHTTHRLTSVNARQMRKRKCLPPGDVGGDHPFRDQAVNFIVARP